MSRSANRVVRQPELGPVLNLVAPDPAALDPVVRQRVDEASQIAYSRGHAEGVALGRQETLRAAETVADGLRQALVESVEGFRQAQVTHADQVLELALALARTVLEREPHDGGRALLERVRAVLEQIDDEQLTVRVSPDDAAYLEQGLAGAHGVSVSPDPSVRPGEARVIGPWTRADLTVEAALEALREVLDA